MQRADPVPSRTHLGVNTNKRTSGSPNYQALSGNSIVGPRASGFSSGKDGEAGDIGYIVDAAGRSPDGKQAARSQIELSDIA